MVIMGRLCKANFPRLSLLTLSRRTAAKAKSRRELEDQVGVMYKFKRGRIRSIFHLEWKIIAHLSSALDGIEPV